MVTDIPLIKRHKNPEIHLHSTRGTPIAGGAPGRLSASIVADRVGAMGRPGGTGPGLIARGT